MHDLARAFLIIVFSTIIIWFVLGFILYVFFIENSGLNIPFWYILIILIAGIVISIGIGFATIFEKYLWKNW